MIRIVNEGTSKKEEVRDFDKLYYYVQRDLNNYGEDYKEISAYQIENVLLDGLHNCGYTLKTLHLASRETWKEIKKQLNFDLWSKIKVGGKLQDECVFSIERYFLRASYSENENCWRKTKVDMNDINSAKGYYEQDQYGYPIKISKKEFEELISTKTNSSHYVGIGSQASSYDITVTVKKDTLGNLMFNEFIIHYD